MKIAITSPSFCKNPKLLQEMQSLNAEVKLNHDGVRLAGDMLFEFLKGIDAAIVSLEKVDSILLEACPQLKFISKYGVGLDNIDFSVCRQKNIEIGWTPGVNSLSVAELTLNFMLNLMSNAFFRSNELKNGFWNKQGGSQLSGKTVGLVGMGHIGKQVVRLLQPFGCHILVHDKIEQSDFYRQHEITSVDFHRLLIRSDIVSLHLPLTDTTGHMMSAHEFNLMKKSAFFINTSRGELVDQAALKEALYNKEILGAAIDVYDQEPVEDRELLKLPNLICTPHIGGITEESVFAMGMTAIAHLREYLEKCKK